MNKSFLQLTAMFSSKKIWRSLRYELYGLQKIGHVKNEQMNKQRG